MRGAFCSVAIFLFAKVGLANPSCENAFVLLVAPQDAYLKYQELENHKNRILEGVSKDPLQVLSFDSKVPIVRSLEKEGLLFSDIAPWFNRINPKTFPKLRERFEREQANNRGGFLKWLTEIELKPEVKISKFSWSQRTPYQRLAFLLRQENFFDLIEVDALEILFDKNIISYDDLLPSDRAPKKVRIIDDLGSYEVLLDVGLADRTEYLALKAKVESFLEGRVGHQHKFHGWPESLSERERVGPHYIELLDATTWFLFWRQMKRDPEEIESILFHPYLGVYTKHSLNRLFKAFLQNNPKAFEDFHRMVGARNFPAHAGLPEQGTGLVPDWEIRSGNKGPKESLVDLMLEARLASGDYGALKDFRSYDFEPSQPLEKLLDPLMTLDEIAVLKKFESTFTEMRFSEHGNADNHFRNRIVSPFFGWENRLDLNYKKSLLFTSRKEYAYALLKIAKKYQDGLNSQSKAELRAATMARIEKALFQFSSRVRLDVDFENYLVPSPKKLPSITVASTGSYDVNQIPLGIEYSLRFSPGFAPRSQGQAEQLIYNFAAKFSEKLGGSLPQKTEKGGHGHNIIVKYVFQDPSSRTWRIEWDGIQRAYKNGQAQNAWGGHIEVPTPKIIPQEFDQSMKMIFEAGRELNMRPSRQAGGAHMNMDLSLLKAQEDQLKSARALVNMINYFESHQLLILMMWQHPKRWHASNPVKLTKGLIEGLNRFKGDWRDLARLLYQERYFNVYVGRKPKYVPLNVTALMTEVVPKDYLQTVLDIKNPEQKWFPNFNEVTDRIEARFFDAPEDEFMAALQIKWWRAFMNKTLNSPKSLKLTTKFSALDAFNWRRNPQKWFEAANKHLIELGLDPKEFEALLWSSLKNHQKFSVNKKEYKAFNEFLPVDSEGDK